MCGIFGFVGKRSRAESIDLRVAIKSLHHRGPDDSGTYFGISQSDPAVACAFAHTRLSILDLSAAGHQPMTTDDGRYTITYNGEVYNFRDIRAELEGLGDRFRSGCDTEVVLRSYARWGRDCVQRFRGMFAFTIWDQVDGTLFLVRDRLGIKPLYLAETADGLFFSSELRTLLATGVAPRQLSLRGLSSYLRFGAVSEPDTIIEGIRSLQAGHRAVWKTTLREDRYWHMPLSRDDGSTFDDYLQRVRAVLPHAVASELVSDVPLGVFLSGGVDSSAIVALASAASTRPVHTFTVTFDEPEYSEERYAAIVANRYGTDHHQVRLNVGEVGDFTSVFRALDQPSADGLNTYFMARAAKEAGLSVVLSGLGGDELFAGYPNFRKIHALNAAAGLAHGLTALAPAAVDYLLRSNALPNRTRKLLAVMRAGGDPERTYFSLRAMFYEPQVWQFAPATRELNGQPHTRTSPGDWISYYSRMELSHYVANTLLRDTDAMSMAHSLEVRVPLLDHELTETLLSIPGWAKVRRRESKPLLVEGLGALRLPSEIVKRKKMGFTLPLEHWFRGSLRGTMAGLLDGTARSMPAAIDGAEITRTWSGFLKGDRYVSYARVWCLAALVGWCDENGVRA